MVRRGLVSEEFVHRSVNVAPDVDEEVYETKPITYCVPDEDATHVAYHDADAQTAVSMLQLNIHLSVSCFCKVPPSCSLQASSAISRSYSLHFAAVHKNLCKNKAKNRIFTVIL